MNLKYKTACLIKGLAIIALVAIAKAAAGREVTDLGAGTAYSINNSGLIAGTDSQGNVFLWESGNYHALPMTSSGAVGINELAQVAGAALINGVKYPAIFGDKGQVTVISDRPGACHSINSFGHATGFFLVGGERHAFLYDGFQMHDLGCPAGGRFCYSEGFTINDLDMVVGATADEHAFFYDGFRMMAFDLGTEGGRAIGINNSAQICGYYHKLGVGFGFSEGKSGFVSFSGDTLHVAGFAINDSGIVAGGAWFHRPSRDEWYSGAITFENGVIHSLSDETGMQILWAYGINNASVIVGRAVINGEQRAVRITP